MPFRFFAFSRLSHLFSSLLLLIFFFIFVSYSCANSILECTATSTTREREKAERKKPNCGKIKRENVRFVNESCLWNTFAMWCALFFKNLNVCFLHFGRLLNEFASAVTQFGASALYSSICLYWFWMGTLHQNLFVALGQTKANNKPCETSSFIAHCLLSKVEAHFTFSNKWNCKLGNSNWRSTNPDYSF